MDLFLSKEDIDKLAEIIERELLSDGVSHAFMVHSSGSLIVEAGTLPIDQIEVLAVLAAANFCATTRIAQLIGQDVSGLLFHMGPSQSIHVFNMNRDYILVALFGNDLPVGVVRLGCARASEQMLPILPSEDEEAPGHS